MYVKLIKKVDAICGSRTEVRTPNLMETLAGSVHVMEGFCHKILKFVTALFVIMPTLHLGN